MQQLILEEWSRKICAWGLGETVAALIDSLGPLCFVVAQVLYFSQPIVSVFLSDHRMSTLIDLFEDPRQSRLFISFLQDGVQR